MTQASEPKNKGQNFMIRVANQRDMPQIIDTQLKSLAILANRDYYPHQLQALLASKNCQRPRLEIIFVAEIEQKIVGFAALDPKTNSLAGLFVNPDYTRQGIGTKLIQTIEQEAINLKIPILWVCASLTGYPFYLANKYQDLGKTHILLGCTVIPCIQMRKRLLTPTKIEQTQHILSQLLMWFLIIWSLVIMIAKF